MLKAIHRVSVQIVWGGIHRAMAGGLGDLQIRAVLTGSAMQPALPHIQRRHRRVDGLERKAGHGAGGHAHHPGGRAYGQGVIRHGEVGRAGDAGFLHKHPERSLLRPLERTVVKIVAVQVAHPVPPAAEGILEGFFYLHGCVLCEASGPQTVRIHAA